MTRCVLRRSHGRPVVEAEVVDAVAELVEHRLGPVVVVGDVGEDAHVALAVDVDAERVLVLARAREEVAAREDRRRPRARCPRTCAARARRRPSPRTAGRGRPRPPAAAPGRTGPRSATAAARRRRSRSAPRGARRARPSSARTAPRVARRRRRASAISCSSSSSSTREREREPVAVAERARGLVAQARELAHVVGDLGADGLRRLPGLAPLVDVVALAQDPLDLVVVDLLAARRVPRWREKRDLDRRTRARRSASGASRGSGAGASALRSSSRLRAAAVASRLRAHSTSAKSSRSARASEYASSASARRRSFSSVASTFDVPPGDVAGVVERPQRLDGRSDERRSRARAYPAPASATRIIFLAGNATTFLHTHGCWRMPTIRERCAEVVQARCSASSTRTRAGATATSTVAELVDLYGRNGFDVLCVTDHVVRSDDPWLDVDARLDTSVDAASVDARTSPRSRREASAGAARPTGWSSSRGSSSRFNDYDPMKAAHAVALGLRSFVSVDRRDRGGDRDGRRGRRRGHRGAPVTTARPQPSSSRLTRRFARDEALRGLVHRFELFNRDAALRLGRGRRAAGGRVRRLPPAEHLGGWKTLVPSLRGRGRRRRRISARAAGLPHRLERTRPSCRLTTVRAGTCAGPSGGRLPTESVTRVLACPNTRGLASESHRLPTTRLESARGDVASRPARSRGAGTPTRPSSSSSGSGSSAARGSTSGRTDEVAEPGSFAATRAGARPGRPRPRRGGRAPRVPQRLPPPRLARLRRVREAARRSSARTTPGRTASTAASSPRRARARGRPRHRRARPRAAARSRPGARSCSSTRTPTPARSPSSSTTSPSASPTPASTSTRSASSSAPSPSSPRTGRSAPRTSSSATTARSRIRASRPSWTSRPTSYLLETRRRAHVPGGPPRPEPRGSYDPAGEVERGQFHLLFPDTVINVMPGRPNLSIGPILPLGPERTYRFLDYFVAPDATERVDRRDARLRRAGRRGGHACSSSASSAGVASGLLARGPAPAGVRAPRRALPGARRRRARLSEPAPPFTGKQPRGRRVPSMIVALATRVRSEPQSALPQPGAVAARLPRARARARRRTRRCRCSSACKFCAIFASNLDEFFQVRVAGLLGQAESGPRDAAPPDGLTPQQALARIRERVLELIARQARIWKKRAPPRARRRGHRHRRDRGRATRTSSQALERHYQREIYPVLTPLAVGPGQPFPYISGLSLSLAVFVADPRDRRGALRAREDPGGPPALPRDRRSRPLRPARAGHRALPAVALPGRHDPRARRVPRHARRRLRGLGRRRRPARGGRDAAPQAPLRRRRARRGELVGVGRDGRPPRRAASAPTRRRSTAARARSTSPTSWS